MKHLTLQRLQVFCAVYLHGSISLAARHLGISQPTASRHLRDFEASLNVALFELRRGHLHPTREADKLYDESRPLAESLGRLEKVVEGMAAGEDIGLAIATISLFSREHMAYAVRRLLKAQPRLKLTVTISLAEQQVALIRNGRVDLGIVAGAVEATGLYLHRLGVCDMVILVPEEHPAATCASLLLDDFPADLMVLAMSPRGHIGGMICDALARHGIRTDERLSTHSLDALPHLAQIRGAATIVDRFTALGVPAKGMKLLELEPQLSFTVNLIAKAPLREGSPHALFAQAMEKSLRQTSPEQPAKENGSERRNFSSS